MADELPQLALSVRQPWAWAIMHAGKRLENRSAIAISRGGMKPGRICIHASKGMTRDEYEDALVAIACATVGKDITVPKPCDLIRGGIIGTVTVTGRTHHSNDPWFYGPHALMLENPVPLAEPIPCSGELGYFKWFSSMAGDLDDPKPWMTAWPDDYKALRPTRTSEKQQQYDEAMARMKARPQ